MTIPRYLAAACQTDRPNPRHRSEIANNVSHMLTMAERAVVGYEPFGDVKLLVFPEFAHAAPVYETAAELHEKLAVELPNDHTDRYREFCKKHRVYIQTGSFLESITQYPGHVFNTTCLIGPDGVLYKYRKVNPWIPWEVHTSPHDLPNFPEPLFPVADTEIGKLGTAICYDWVFPETIRELVLSDQQNRNPKFNNLFFP